MEITVTPPTLNIEASGSAKWCSWNIAYKAYEISNETRSLPCNKFIGPQVHEATVHKK